jgi:hypothetical protein
MTIWKVETLTGLPKISISRFLMKRETKNKGGKVYSTGVHLFSKCVAILHMSLA